MQEVVSKKVLKIPLDVLANRDVGPLEAIIFHLREKHGLRFSEIASLLNRDQRTVWASYHNASKKLDPSAAKRVRETDVKAR